MTNEERTQRIMDLVKSLVGHFETLLPEKKYTTAELYISCAYIQKLAGKTLGPEATAKVDQNFWIIDPEDWNDA